jgi:hypothetical protein
LSCLFFPFVLAVLSVPIPAPSVPAPFSFPIVLFVPLPLTDKKENKIFLIYKEIQSGTVAKSYMRQGFLIFEEMRKYFRMPLVI